MFDNENGTEIVQAGAMGEITKSEIQAQVDVAHRYPRSIKTFLQEAKTMATMTREIAESCIYSLPRGKDPITGPGVRLAEIAASTYGNLQIGARVVDSSGFAEVVAQGLAWDMERNVRIVTETRRNIQTKEGKRFTNDMVVVTGNAAASIALRNAVFRIVPKCYIDDIYRAAVECAVGDSKSFVATRAAWIARLNKAGVSTERILARLEKPSVEDLTLDDVEKIIGLGNAIKSKDVTFDEAFPAVVAAPAPAPPEQDGKRVSVGKSAQSKPVAKSEPTTKPVITPAEVTQLMNAAIESGDAKFAKTCEAALDGDFEALAACQERLKRTMREPGQD
jgi:hypothetical protein